jgi:TolB protein
MKNFFLWLSLSSVLAVSAQNAEPHLSNFKQLTFGGDNAEAYFSSDGKKLSFQSNNPQWGLKCDQVFYMIIEEAEDNRTYQPIMVSNGEGRNTCSYYLPGDKKILFSSTFKSATGKECPQDPPKEGKFWAVNPGLDIFVADEKGKISKQLTASPGYDAEATISPKGDKIVFTSDRNGDLDLYVMDTDGKNVKQLTTSFGYDGGAFFSPDGTQIVFRASRPKGKDSIEYKELLTKGLVEPHNMELYIMNVDGTGIKQVTSLGKTNWAPFFHPSGKKIIFSSNNHSADGSNFQLYIINTDGTGLVRITNESNFNAFPMFSPDGKKIVFSSARNAETNETNLFIADWIEEEVQIAD